MFPLIASVLFWSIFATVIACVEIESEGKFGWADKAPTWYRTTGFWGRLYGLCMGGKPLTGYHAFMFFLPLMVFHAHFFLGVPWSKSAELKAWALYFSWSVLWDYLWFVLNPHYAGKFRRDHVWWHAKSPWVFGLFPLDYLLGVIMSCLLATGAAWLAGSATPLIDHLKLLAGFGAYLALAHLLAPLYRRWYHKMRERDDRDKVEIFYRD